MFNFGFFSRSPASSSTFEDTYSLGTRELGSGTFGTVYRATNVIKMQMCAVKVIARAKMEERDEANVRGEIKILKETRGAPGIIKFVQSFEEPERHYIVMELMSGGELFSRISENGSYTEKDAKQAIKVLATALKFLHKRDIVHRDLKPENVLLKDGTNIATIKLADFGLARHVGKEGCGTACGTPAYIAPEVLRGKLYGVQCDVWSLGVLTYFLLCGHMPFDAAERKELYRKIRSGAFNFDGANWSNVSPQAKDLISKTLVLDPENRYTAAQVLGHAWIVGASSTNAIDAQPLKLSNAKRHLRNAFVVAIKDGKIQNLVKLVKKVMD